MGAHFVGLVVRESELFYLEPVHQCRQSADGWKGLKSVCAAILLVE